MPISTASANILTFCSNPCCPVINLSETAVTPSEAFPTLPKDSANVLFAFSWSPTILDRENMPVDNPTKAKPLSFKAFK